MITSAASNCRCADTNTAAIKNVWLVLKAIAYRIVIDVLILDIIVYELRKFYESKFREEQKPSILPPENLCRRFSIGEIQSATNGFDDRLLVGQGGFGPVFKGILDNGATTVAVKRLSPKSNQGAPEFWNEIEMLSRFRHSNVVSLVGYCCDCYEMILVYEYSLLGSLHDHLHKMVKNGNPSLSWVKRLEICIGAARGLDYLHTGTGVTRGVIHRDVKSANIVLDENWAAKISDFGLSKVGPANHSFSYVSTDVKGTFGYLDPEYFVTGKLTTRSDVYSFGVVLLEVLSGRPAVDMSLDEEQWGLARWSQRCIRKGVLDRIIDPSLKGKIMPDCLMEFARIAEQCLHNHPKKRPKMTEVVARLEFALAMQENVNFSGEVIFAGWPHYNQEKADSSREDEIANACNGEYHNEQINGISDSRGAYEHEKNEDHSTGHRILSVNSDGHQDRQIDGISDYTSAFDSEENSYNSFTPQKLSSACNSEKYDEQIDRISNHSWAMVKNGNPSLSWVKRLEICIGAARGLDYLHTGTGVTRGVIHRDVKSANIVLDENWAAKISDFGLSKVGPANHSFSYVSTDVKGTFGYLDPEYFVTGKLTTRSDVYSFGVVLLEVLSGRPAVDMSLDEEQWGLARWSQRCIRKGVLDRIIDPSLKGKIMPDCLMEFARIAEQCLHNHPKKRPKMTEVVTRLEFALAMQENVNFSGEVIFAGWPHYNQEKADSSREDEIANACNGEYHNEQINGISDSRGAYEHENNEDHSTGHRILSVNSDGHQDRQIDGISDYTSAFDSEENSYNSFTPQKLSSACNSEKYDEQIDRISNHSWAGGNVKKTDFVAGRIKDKQIGINQDNRDLNMEQEAVNVAPSLQTPAISRLGDASGGQLHIELSKMRSLWQFINEYKRQRTNNVPKGCDAKPSRNCTDDSLFLSGNGMAPYLKEFTLAELKMATRNFKLEEKLGDGGFGKVFKGWVDCMTYAPSKASIGMAVAVRYLCGFHISKEVESEAKFFGKFNHPNLAKLLGYCFKDRNFYLEYMPNRSLESCLFRRNLTLPWDARIKMVAGVARVLAFLHTTEEHIIHRDIKASNILLDAEFNAKLSDFGLLPKLDPANGQSHVTMRMPGSYSYAAPKCLAAGQLTKKSDVYAFGVLLLEVLMGLRVIDINRPPGKHNVVNLLRPFLDRGELGTIMHRRLIGHYSPRSAFKVVQLILKCLEGDRRNRPTMKEVLKILEQINDDESKGELQSQCMPTHCAMIRMAPDR
ncbi:hypothetical protein RJ640_003067 [Escallonia rubra]|uniref:Protein kinase domain-containing protein n=1 Tax=Escallonia rubra TaxID=112253 RepID=A0AA88QAM6_9ASTE|nr:hypothetical protein RJ640_003067 [Escallonia rubra]